MIINASPPLPPLVVDLDGTLLRSDLLLETGMAFVRSHPLQAYKPLAWLSKGKIALKEGLARKSDIDVTVLPYDPAVIEVIEAERALGRQTILATASHESLAGRVAEHLQLFDLVLATDSTRNLSAHRKRDVLVELYGQGGFDYMGNSMDDICVWEAARKAYVVNPESGVERRARAHGNVEQVIVSNPGGVRPWLKALRLHQWMKNALIFVPLLAAHQVLNPMLLLQCILAFVLFGLCASSVYLLNDLLDLNDDRHHASKRHRPFASGRLSIRAGLLAFPVLLIAAFGGGGLAFTLGFFRYFAGLLHPDAGLFAVAQAQDGHGCDCPGHALHRAYRGWGGGKRPGSDVLGTVVLDVHFPESGAGQALL